MYLHACTHGAFVKIEEIPGAQLVDDRWWLFMAIWLLHISWIPLNHKIHVVASNFTERPLSFAFVWWRNHSLTIFNNCRKSAADSTFFDLQAHWNRWFQGSISSGQNILKLGKPWKREATLSMSLKWYYIDDIGSFACCGWARTNELGRFSKLWLTSSAGAGHVQVSDIGFAQHQLNIFEPAYLGMICSASCGALSSACATFLPQPLHLQQVRLQVQIQIVALAYPAYLCRVASSLCASWCVCVCATSLRRSENYVPWTPWFQKNHLLKTK